MNDRPAKPGESPDLQIPEAVELFIRRKRPEWKGSSERAYRRDLGDFEDYAAEREIETTDDLTRWNIGGFTDYLLAQDYARVTVAGRQKKAKTWLKFLESQGILSLGMHLAIDTLSLDEREETSDEKLAPGDARTLLAFYRDSNVWRATRRHAILEVFWHVGCRLSGLRALDLRDYDSETGDLRFRNRPETGTRLKRGQQHERNATLSETPNEILSRYVSYERSDVRDEHGRKPLFPSREGRASDSGIRAWMYLGTQPCVAQECPHGKERETCEYVSRDAASKCPSSRPPHPIRRGSITWQRNIGFDEDTVASRAASTPEVIRRFYDDPGYDAELERRRDETEKIDIAEHMHPTDLEDSE